MCRLSQSLVSMGKRIAIFTCHPLMSAVNATVPSVAWPAPSFFGCAMFRAEFFLTNQNNPNRRYYRGWTIDD